MLLFALALVTPRAVADPHITYDHLTTGFELIGQHRDLRCEACHANAMFKGTPTDCGACHGIGTVIRATAKSTNHILSTDQCSACHTPIAWTPAVNFDHTQARGSCSSCHNGIQAQGKGPTHIATDLECDACHTTLTWAGAEFTHQGVTDKCASCHNGVSATGMPPTHIPAGTPPTPCEGCHSTTNFTTFAGTKINHLAVTAMSCASCHETANYLGMHPGTNTAAGDSRPNATLDANHPKSGDCGQCHDTTNFGPGALRPANHIPTSAPCVQCHTTPGKYALYSVTGVHQGVTGCVGCHGPAVASTFFNITMVTTPANHFPIGSLDCNGSGCHSTKDVNPGGFRLGAASIASPTLTVAGHTTIAAAVSGCQSCHESAPYIGMLAGTATAAGDSRPSSALDAKHPSSGDCNGCHTTTPTFASDLGAGGKPANHIPTSAACAQCHTTAGNYALYSLTGTHQGVTGCLTCHGPAVGPFINVTMVSTPANHFPIGGLDCNGSGCHGTSNVNPGGFKLGTASLTSPTLTVAGHTTVAAAVTTCQSCHETAPYLGMLAGSATAAGDSRPTTFDKNHPTSGDCSGCHTTTPTFASDLTAAGKPSNHIPTSAACAQCHTTAGNYALYSVTGTHQGVSGCLTCHGPLVAGTFANVTIVSASASHFPIGSLDCNGSGCHSTANVNAGGFKLGTANITAPTLTVAGHTTVAAAVGACATCHESAPYTGMLASTATAAGDSRPTALDSKHPTSGDCGTCHVTTPTFATDLLPTAPKPANHIPTTAVCAQCHTTAGNFALYSLTGTHQGITGCLTCHGPTVGPFINVTMVTTPANHFPIGSLDCNGSGCHGTSNVNPGGFKLGTASIASPTLSIAGHSTVAAAVAACQTCHETAPYAGMLASSATAAGDSRPTALDKNHPTSGDCSGCHTTTPTFASDLTGAAKPANHIPTTAACTQCHSTAGNYALYSVTGTHQGVTTCLTCHAPAVATTFANISIITTPANHFPIGSLDCNGSGCHSIGNVNPGGFKLGAANISVPTLNAAGHATVASAAACATCHETAPYAGMLASTATAAGDSRPTALDKNHPTSGDCGTCHVVTPTFATNLLPTAPKPANHIPTTAVCAQCHTTAGNYAVYSLTGTHQGVTGCLTCHGPTVGPFINVTMVSTPANHFPIGSLDCNGSGCHGTGNVNPGGFKLGSASPSSPTLTVAGHATVAAAVSGCQTCHETAPYAGMLASTATMAGDSRPTALDKNHPTSGDCSGCHTTTPLFASDLTANSKPANHIPTSAPCAQCHTTAGNYALYSVAATHQGVSGCLTCHAPAVASTFANVTIVSTPANHFPIGSLDCNGSGCHSTGNVNAGGFKLGTASIASPTLNVGGHATIAAAVSACTTCHESAPYVGMLASSATSAGDSRPTALDKLHPTSGDCSGCHTTTPTFAGDLTSGSKPANHIPTSAPCAQCHTTAGNYALYSVTATHQGVSGCLTCHGPTVASTFANVTIVSTPANHFPIGSLDCNGSGCHGTGNVKPGGFKLGSANISSPTLTAAGHVTVSAAVGACATCHETRPVHRHAREQRHQRGGFAPHGV